MSAGFLAKAAAMKAAQSNPNQAAQTQAPAQEPVTEAVQASVSQAPAPWAYPSCPQCKDTSHAGIHEGQPCNICVISTNAEKLKNPNQAVADDYDVVVGDDGLVTWTSKESGEPVAEAQVVEEEPVVKEVVDSKGGSEFKEPEPVAEAAQAPAKEPEPAGPVLGDANPKEFELERTGFLLSYNRVSPRKRVSKKLGESNCVVTAQEILSFVEPHLMAIANSHGACAKMWYDIKTFDRRELIERNAKEIAEKISNSMVDASCVTKGTDEAVLIASIERYASVLIGEMG